MRTVNASQNTTTVSIIHVIKNQKRFFLNNFMCSLLNPQLATDYTFFLTGSNYEYHQRIFIILVCPSLYDFFPQN
jgi:arginine exporter protein ArgO